MILNGLCEESFDDLTGIAAYVCNTPIGLIHFFGNNRHTVKSVVGLTSNVDLSDLPFFSHAILQRDVFIVPDASADERFLANPLVKSGPQIRFYAGAPLITPRGEVLGTLSVMSSWPKLLNPDQIELLCLLARQAIRRVNLWRDHIELRQRVSAHKSFQERLAAELAIADILIQAKTPSEALPRILQALCECLGWTVGIFWQMNNQVNVLTCAEIWKVSSMNASEFEAFSRKDIFWPDEELPGCVWTRGEIDWIRDLADEKRSHRTSLAVKEGLRGAVAVPIRGQNKVLGVMEFFCREKREPDDNLLELMLNLGIQVGQFIEQKRVEENVIQLANVVELSEDAIIGTTLDGNITSWNRSAQKAFGYPPEKVLGQPVAILLLPDRLNEFFEILERIKQGEQVDRHEMVFINENGERIDVSLTISPIKDNTGKVIGALSIKRNFAKHKQTEEALRESEARKEAILESSLDCIIIIDHEGNIVESNPAVEYTFGYNGSEIIGKDMMGLMISPSFGEQLRKCLARYSVSGEGNILYRRIEIRAVRADGSEFPAELKITRTFLKGPPLFAVSIRDISERRWIEQERNRLLIQQRATRTEAEEA